MQLGAFDYIPKRFSATHLEILVDRAVQALDSMTVQSVHTTIDLQRSILNDPAFRKGEYDIDHLADLESVRMVDTNPGNDQV